MISSAAIHFFPFSLLHNPMINKTTLIISKIVITQNPLPTNINIQANEKKVKKPSASHSESPIFGQAGVSIKLTNTAISENKTKIRME